MTRRDIIIIATLANLGLLAILFMMAVKTDDDKISNESVEIAQAAETPYQPTEIQLENHVAEMPMAAKATGDEVDNALKEFAEASSQNRIAANEDSVIVDDEEPSSASEQPRVPSESQEIPSNKYIEVTVKRGDTLEKIARANGTTISAIKEASQLKSDRLNIGQVLRVPTSDKKIVVAAKTTPNTLTKSKETQKEATTQTVQTNAPQYYSIRAGDNPWKIAKQFHLKVDELLSLNNLDEEKARNLKVGDKIRVR